MGLLSNYTERNEDISSLSDEELLRLSVRTPSVFGVLVSRYEEAFFRKVLGIIHNGEEAEDIVQEAFTKMYLNARRFHDVENGSFRAWAYKIVVNTTFSHYKKLKREKDFRTALDPELYEILPDLSSMPFEAEGIRDYVASVFSRMPAHLARVLQRAFIEDRSHKDIADEEGVSISVVKTRVYRAKRAFKKALAGTDNL